MEPTPTAEELESTIERMHARYSQSPDELTAQLLDAADTLRSRFAADFPDRRDRALSNAAALMLVRAVAESRG